MTNLNIKKTSKDINIDSYVLAEDIAVFIINNKYKQHHLIFDYDEVNNCYIYKEEIAEEYEELADSLNQYLINQYSNMIIYDRTDKRI